MYAEAKSRADRACVCVCVCVSFTYVSQVLAGRGSYRLSADSTTGQHVTPDALLSLCRSLAAVNYINDSLWESMALATRAMLGFCR